MSQPPGWPATGRPPEQPYQGQSYQGQSYQVQPYPTAPSPEPYQPPYPSRPYHEEQGRPPLPVAQPVPQQPWPGSGPPYQPPAHGPYQQPTPGYPAGYQPHYPAPTGWPAPAPVRRTGMGSLVAMISVLLALGLVGGGIWAISRISTDHPAADGGRSPGPATSSPAAAASSAATSKVTLVTPDSVAGQPRITDPTIARYADQVTQALSDKSGATSTIAAFYGDTSRTSTMFGVVGAATALDDPKAAVQDSFTGYGTITNVSSVDPGPLGGYAQCGRTTESGSIVAVCGWGDPASLVLVIAFGRTPSQCAELMRTVRGQVEKRN